MKRTLFRILAFPLPTRNMRNYVRRLGGPKIIPPAKHITDVLYASIDIAGVPRARGFMRYVQQANLRLLWAFDKFATENHLEYFMIGGAIAGLIRYSACVPWDDDIDVGMTAENYTKFLQLIRKTLPNNEYSLMLTSNVFRIVHNKTKAFLDILRYGVQKTPDCYKQDGVIIYPDMVKVKINASDGHVTGCETLQYLFNHTQRSLEKPALSSEDILSRKWGELETKSVRLAVIPTPGGGERLAYEVYGTVGEEKFFVYADVNTGREVRVLKVVDSEQGELLI